jgi:hypothetical protein
MRGSPLLTKPPLLHWTIVGSTSVLGLNEFAVRLPGACFALGTALVVFLVGRRFMHERAAFIAAIALLTAPVLLHSHWRAAEIDVLLTLLTSSALLSLFAALNADGEEKRSGLLLLFFGLIGLAGMAKGPAGLGAPLLIGLVYVVAFRRWRRLSPLPLVVGLLVALVLGGWWYTAVLARFGGLKGVQELMGANAATYFGWEHEIAPAVSWFYVPRILGDFFPWSFLLPAAVVLAVRVARRGENRLVGFLLVWLAVHFLVFSLLGKKAGRYMLPLYPAAALLVGLLCHRLIERTLSPGLGRWAHGGVIAAAAVCIAGLILVIAVAGDFDFESWYVTKRWTESKDRLMLSEISRLMRAHFEVTLCLAGVLVAGFAAGAMLWRRRTAAAIALITAAAAGMSLAFDAALVPALDRTFSPRYFARHIAALVPKRTPLAGYCEASGQIDDCTHFYLGRAADVLLTRRQLRDWATQSAPRYVFMLEEDVQEASGVIYEWFELVDDSSTYRRQKVLLFRNRPEHSAPPGPE